MKRLAKTLFAALPTGRHRPLMAALVVGFCVLSFSADSDASTVVRLDLESLVANSDRIVHGTVEEVASRTEKGRVFTYTTIRVEDSLKGENGDEIRLRQLGGETEERAMWVPGMPQFHNGEEVVIFVEQPENSEFAVVTGMMQGKFRVAVGPDGTTRYAVPYLGDIALVREQKTRQAPPTDSATAEDSGEVGPRIESAKPADLYRIVQPLSVFKERIRATVRDQESR